MAEVAHLWDDRLVSLTTLERSSRIKGSHLRHRASLPPLDGRNPPHRDASNWSTEPPLRPRGRSSERAPEPPPIPRDPRMPQPVSSRALMARRTFNLPRGESDSRALTADCKALAPLRQASISSRPPRPLADTLEAEADLPEVQFPRWYRSESVTPPASETQSRSTSQCEGSEAGPTRSILRTSHSRERSSLKRVSFSQDCKRAPPGSIADLIRTCPDEFEQVETHMQADA